MSKKKTAGIVFGVLILLFVAVMSYPFDWKAIEAREKYGDDIQLSTDSYGNICATTQIENAFAPKWKCDYSLTAKPLTQHTREGYVQDVWKIKVNHYNNLILFKDGGFNCEWIDEKISEIRDTRKTNWSPLDQRQWNEMLNDYVKTRGEMCN